MFKSGLRICALVFGFIVLTTAASASPRTDYMLKCMGCHGPDGAEVVGKVPALKDSVARFLNVEGGRAYLVKVPGTRQTPLDDQRVADLLNWLLPHFDAAHMPKDFAPYTGEEVKALRAHQLPDVVATRAQLIEALEEKAPY
ncbi:MAG: cytochrome c [Parvibaculum sp.]